MTNQDVPNFDNLFPGTWLKAGELSGPTDVVIVRITQEEVGINQEPSGEITGEDPGTVNQTGTGSSKAKNRAETKTAKAKGGDVVFLINNLPYAERIEDGWSPQAAGGVVGVSIAEFQSIVEKVGGELIKT